MKNNHTSEREKNRMDSISAGLVVALVLVLIQAVNYLLNYIFGPLIEGLIYIPSAIIIAAVFLIFESKRKK